MGSERRVVRMTHNAIGQFVVIYNYDNWMQYKNEMSSQLLKEHGNCSTVEFPADPKSYPCLVASMLTPIEPTVANRFCYFHVNCCFVYVADAVRLVEVKAKLDPSSTVVVDTYDKLHVQEEDTKFSMLPREEVYAPTQTAVLLLALVVEMEAIGALKHDKLLEQLEYVEKWLLDNQEHNLANYALSSVLSRLWEDKNAS